MFSLVVLAVLIGFFAGSWLGLVSTTFCLAVPATGIILAIMAEHATPAAMAESFLGLWAVLLTGTGIPYLVKRLFISLPRRRRKIVPRPRARDQPA